jgi:hypothetical protein
MEMTRRRYQAYRLRIQSEYVKRMETTPRRYQAYRLRIGCVSTVRNGSTRQTDRLLSNDDRRLSSLEACNGPAATTVASSTTTGGNGSSTGFKGAGNGNNSSSSSIDKTVQLSSSSSSSSSLLLLLFMNSRGEDIFLNEDDINEDDINSVNNSNSYNNNNNNNSNKDTVELEQRPNAHYRNTILRVSQKHLTSTGFSQSKSTLRCYGHAQEVVGEGEA